MARRTLGRRKGSAVENRMKAIKEEWSKQRLVCTTADVWSPKHRSYMGVEPCAGRAAPSPPTFLARRRRRFLWIGAPPPPPPIIPRRAAEDTLICLIVLLHISCFA